MLNSKEKIEKIAEQNFLNWSEMLKVKNSEQAAELYSEDTTFLPTLSSDFKKGKKGVKEYFEHFLRKNPTGKIIEQIVQLLSEDIYLHSGLYDFEVGPKESRTNVKARFTYVWRRNKKNEWKIIHHHSSLKPE